MINKRKGTRISFYLIFNKNTKTRRNDIKQRSDNFINFGSFATSSSERVQSYEILLNIFAVQTSCIQMSRVKNLRRGEGSSGERSTVHRISLYRSRRDHLASV